MKGKIFRIIHRFKGGYIVVVTGETKMEVQERVRQTIQYHHKRGWVLQDEKIIIDDDSGLAEFACFMEFRNPTYWPKVSK